MFLQRPLEKANKRWWWCDHSQWPQTEAGLICHCCPQLVASCMCHTCFITAGQCASTVVHLTIISVYRKWILFWLSYFHLSVVTVSYLALVLSCSSGTVEPTQAFIFLSLDWFQNTTLMKTHSFFFFHFSSAFQVFNYFFSSSSEWGKH